MDGPVIVLGGVQSDFARNLRREGTSFTDLLREVTLGALESTGIPLSEIGRLRDDDRVVVAVGNFQGDHFLRQAHLGAFLTEVDPAFHGVAGARHEAACASGSMALGSAAARLRAGDYDLAVVVGIEVMKTVSPIEGNDYLGLAAVYEDEAAGLEFAFPRIFGAFKEAVLERAEVDGPGADRVAEALLQISLTNYGNAVANPQAQTRDRGVDRDGLVALDGRYAGLYGDHIRFSDCCQVTDGAAAVVLATPSYAERWLSGAGRRRGEVAEIAGWGHRVAPVRLATKVEAYRDGAETLVPWTRQAVRDAYGRAGVTASDVDVFETHDCFTISEYLALSALGVAETGREYVAVEDGSITRGGTHPVNPSGGLIGAGHPVGATGVRMVLDLWRQVTGNAGGYQVPDARVGAMLNIGGSATTNATFVVRRAD